MIIKRFINLCDLHWGFERRGGHLVPMHDESALKVALDFAKDFKPHCVILSGDLLDAGCVSHHNAGKPGRTEGMRLINDAKGLRKALIEPLEKLRAQDYIYILGNHDGGWLQDFEEANPAMEGMINVKALLELSNRWKIIPQGGHFELGKLVFIHGDQISGGEQAAKNAVTTYEKSIRMGHFHTAQMFTKNTPQSNKYAKTGACVPSLCRKDLGYSRGKPNRHAQGFNSGYIFPDGTFSDHITIITNGRMVAPSGKVYEA